MKSSKTLKNLSIITLSSVIILVLTISGAVLAQENKNSSFAEDKNFDELLWKGIEKAKAGEFSAAQKEFEKLLSVPTVSLPAKMCLLVIEEVYSHKVSKEDAIRLLNSLDYDSEENTLQNIIPELNKIIASSPRSSIAYCFRGHLYYRIKKISEAMADLNQAVKNNSGNFVAYCGLADIYKAKEEYTLAVANYTQAINLEPKSDWLYDYRAEALVKMGRYQEAISDYTHAINLRPQNPWFYLHRGAAYTKAGQYEKALSDYKKVTDMDNDAFYYVFRRQASLYKKLGRKREEEKAMQEYKQKYYFRRSMPGGKLADIMNKIEDVAEEDED